MSERIGWSIHVKRSRVLPTLGGWMRGRRRPVTAVTIRNTIYVHPDRELTARLRRHELVHVAQWAEHPWTFPLRYAWAHLRHGYSGNPYEIEAEAAE